MKPELTKAEQELAEAKKPVVSAAEQELAKAKSALEQANAAVASAAPTVEHWRRAQAFMGVHRAESSYAELKSKHEELIATAKDAYRGVEQVRAQIAALTKSTAEAPAKLAKAQAEAAAAAKALDIADKAHTSATNALKDKQTAASVDPKAVEGEIAAAQKKLDGLNAELTKRRDAATKTQDGSEERKKADAQVAALQPDIVAAQKLVTDAKAKLADAQAKRTAVAAAEEANKKAEDAENAAHEKSLAADKALAKLKQTSEAEAKQLAELQAKEPKMAQDAAIAKTKAEQEASTVAKQIDQAKEQATRMRAEFEAKWHSNRQASVN
jgi:chromosome segregation ATPase